MKITLEKQTHSVDGECPSCGAALKTAITVPARTVEVKSTAYDDGRGLRAHILYEPEGDTHG